MPVKQIDLFTYDLPSSESTKPKDCGNVVHGGQKINSELWEEWLPVTSRLAEKGIEYWFIGHEERGMYGVRKFSVDIECGTYDYDIGVRDNRNGTYTLSYLNPLTGASWDHDFSNPEELIAEIVRIRNTKI